MEKKAFPALALLAILALPAAAGAQSANVPSNANFTAGVTLGNEQDFDFGTINFSGAPGAGDTVSLGTDGSQVFGGGNFSGSATGTPGRVDVTAGNNGQVVEVFCDQSATLSNAGGTSSIDVVNIKVAPENATGSYAAAGQPCNGVAGAPAHSFTLDLGVLDTFVFGGQIDAATVSGTLGGDYSTQNPGGDDIQVNVFYQ